MVIDDAIMGGTNRCALPHFRVKSVSERSAPARKSDTLLSTPDVIGAMARSLETERNQREAAKAHRSYVLYSRRDTETTGREQFDRFVWFLGITAAIRYPNRILTT